MSKRKISNRKLIIQLGRDESLFALWDKSAQIIHSVALPTPFGAVEDGMIQNPDAVRELLQSAMALPEFEGVHNAIFSLCTSQVITETVVTPNLSGKKLEKLILSNMDMYFPVDISEYRLVWQTIGQNKSIGDLKELSVQLWAIPTAMLSRYYTVGNAAGLSVNAIDYCGNSVASAIGASFSANGKKAKERKKLDLNKEITFGRKKKAEDEAQQEQEAPVEQAAPAADTTDLHLTLEKDLIGLTFVQNNRVVHQRFIQSGSNPTYIFDDVAMMVEYFRSLEQGRNSKIAGYVSGAMCEDTDLVADLSDILDMPLTAPACSCDPRVLLCAGAALTKMDFGMPEMNRPNKELTQKTLQVGQTAALAAGGAALAGVVALTFVARFSWNATIDSLESKRQNLAMQAQKVAGYADKYKEYTTLYDNYSSDWNTVFNSLRTYNDNLVRVMEELEEIMPDKASVTELTIGADGMNVKFACETKEQAAYLIMQLRELQYANLNGISSLSGGGRGAAKTYGNGEKAPTEGSSTLSTTERNELANALISDFNIYNVTAQTSEMSYSEIQAFQSLYGNMPSTDIVLYDGTEMEVFKQCTTLAALEEHYKTIINPGQTITASMRQNAINTLLCSNPFSATAMTSEIAKIEDLGGNALSYYSMDFLFDLMELSDQYNAGTLNRSTPAKTQEAMVATANILKNGANIADTETLIKQNSALEQWYVYYLQDEINKTVGTDVRRDETEEEKQLVDCEYLALDTMIQELVATGKFSSSNTTVNSKLQNLLSNSTKSIVERLMTVDPSTPPSVTPPTTSPSVTPPATSPTVPPSVTPPVIVTPTPPPDTSFLEGIGLTQEDVNKQLDKYINEGKTDYAPFLDDQIDKFVTTGKSDYTDLNDVMNKYIEGGHADNQIRAVAADYLQTGTAKNPVVGKAIEQYLITGKCENAAIDKWAKDFLASDEGQKNTQNCLLAYMSRGTTGYKHLDTMIKKYLEDGKSGYTFIDNMINSYADQMVGGYIKNDTSGNTTIDMVLVRYFTVGSTSLTDLDRIIEIYLDKQVNAKNLVQFDSVYGTYKKYGITGDKLYDKLFKRYDALGSSGSETLDRLIKSYAFANGNKNDVMNALGNSGGGNGQPVDTRIAFTVSLGYNDDLMRAELERKGLSNDSKVDKLEVNG